jgi:zinc protease
MHKIYNLILVLALLFIGFTGYTQKVDRTKYPEPGPAPIIQLGKHESFTLKNGLKVYVVQNKKLPRIAVSLILDYDPFLEKDTVGYVSIAGQLMRSGTKNRTKDQLDEEIDFIGATLNTSASGVYAASLKKHQEKLFELMADVIINPNFKQEELDKLKTQVKSGLAAQKDDPNTIASRVKSVLLYGKDHPYGELTTEQTVENITLEKCREFYNTYYKPNIGYMAIVGDITVAEAKAAATKYLVKWQRGDIPKTQYTTPKPVAKTRIAIVDRPTAVQSVIQIAHPVELKTGAPDAIKARLTNDILGGGSSARLFDNLREKHAFTYGAYSSLSSDKLIGSFNASASVRNAVTDSAVAEFMNELKRIRNEKPTAEELQKSKNSISGAFAMSLENPQTIASFAINRARYNLPADYYHTYLKKVEAVTPEDIQATASKYIRPDHAWILVVGNASEVAEKLKKFGEIEYFDMYGNKTEASALMAAPQGMTAQEVFDNYIRAIGGRSNIDKIKDITIVTTAQLQGHPLTISQYQKMPDKFLVDIRSGDMQLSKTVYDGKQAQMASPMGSQDISGKELEDQRARFTFIPELKYKDYGVKAQLTGIEKINNKDAYKVELTMPGGSKAVNYYDKDSGLKIREENTEESPVGTVTQVTEYDNYKEVMGIKYPHQIKQTVGPQNINATVSKIEINSKLKDELFRIE